MPKSARYLQPIDWRCWANRHKSYVTLGGTEYEAGAVCNDTADTDIGLCKDCYVVLFGEWPPSSGKVREPVSQD